MASAQGTLATTKPLLTVVDVADVLCMSNLTANRLIKSGKLPALRVGKNYRMRESEPEEMPSGRLIDSEKVSG